MNLRKIIDAATPEDPLNDIYDAMNGSPDCLSYFERHDIKSQAVLTITDDEIAALVTESIRDKIKGKTVVEIGGGTGLLALHMGMIADRVFCIEANPLWADTFIALLLKSKPKNVSYLFGAADEFAGHIKADVAVFCTHSGVEWMRDAAALFAPVTIDIYGDMIAENPDAFDKTASQLRMFV